EGFESKPHYPPNKKGHEGLPSLEANCREGLIRQLCWLTPTGRLHFATASCGAARLVERRVRIKASLSTK
ncbi:MAG: hypothetical protein PVJ68_03670, partial [Candidatus Thiodiazotropha sp.]